MVIFKLFRVVFKFVFELVVCISVIGLIGGLNKGNGWLIFIILR